MNSDLANYVSTGIAVAVCFWVTRTYALKQYPYGVPIAIMWACIGISLCVMSLARYLTVEISWFLVVVKLALATLGVLTIVRECAAIDLRELLRGWRVPVQPPSDPERVRYEQWLEDAKTRSRVNPVD